MKKKEINLNTVLETGNIMRSLNSENTTLPAKGDYDKLSLWTFASDVKINDDTTLEEYYEQLIDAMEADEYQLFEMVEFLRDMGYGVTDHTDINTIAARLRTLNEPLVDATRQITGKTLTNTTPLGIANLMQSINTELQDVLDKLDITATGTQDIVSALDSLS